MDEISKDDAIMQDFDNTEVFGDARDVKGGDVKPLKV